MILTAAKAGVQVISKAQLSAAGKLLIASDVNAVPPAGIEGLTVNANSDPLEGTKAVGIGRHPSATLSTRWNSVFSNGR